MALREDDPLRTHLRNTVMGRALPGFQTGSLEKGSHTPFQNIEGNLGASDKATTWSFNLVIVFRPQIWASETLGSPINALR